ncbi:MAG: sulfatase-like hydrolase/transferase [Pyrinomonadaceae bacterium]
MIDNIDRKPNRRQFLSGAIGAAAIAAMIPDQPVVAADRPNLLFILADDLGWGDLSCYGRPDYQTPNLDRLARQGLRFTNAYSAAPVCTPTRVGFHTGRYPARLPVGLMEPITERKELGERIKTVGLPPEHPTVSSLIKSAGYETALIGKWHLGYLPTFGPLRSGFDQFFGIMSGAGDFFTHKDMAGDADLFEGDVPVERAGYITDLLTSRAVEYIRQPRKSPFYLSLHYTAPHWPWEGPMDEAFSRKLGLGPDAFRSGGSLKVYAEMMKSLDGGIGKVLDALKDTGHDRDTVVIFTSDNGGERFSYNWPFSGQKMNVREGGIRVPGIIRWPSVTSVGRTSDQPIITMDWTATLIAAAGTKPDPRFPLDGEDLLMVLNGERGLYDRTFCWRTRSQGAARSGKWKYIRETTTEYLFDLSIDEREQANYKDQEPQILERLRRAFDNWESGMLAYPNG